jgi:hypothetical protein
VPKYEVYATRWDDPHVVEDLIPAKGIEFTLPIKDHGELSFSATKEPGLSVWRSALAPLMSGCLVTRDDQPVWSGFLWSETQPGARTFAFKAAEWGSFLERIPAIAWSYSDELDEAIIVDLIQRASEVAGQDAKITLPTPGGDVRSDVTINPWDDVSVEAKLRQLGDAIDGPDWYFGTAGNLADPIRQLVLGERLGDVTSRTLLQYVEASEPVPAISGPPQLSALGNVFPAVPPSTEGWWLRRGGNVIAPPKRSRDGAGSATATRAIGAGEERAQLNAYDEAADLLDGGWPRLTTTSSYTDVTEQATLQRKATGDLTSRAGLLTAYTLTTFDGDPDWTEIGRGSTVSVSLDTDAYGGPRPLEFDSRLVDLAVKVQDAGEALVNWTTLSRMEV